MDSHEPTSPDEILQAALTREQEAYDFYAGLAMRCHVDYVRDLLDRLKNEEEKHIYLVQQMITKLNLGEDMS